jgi:hypothetical protein
MMPANIRSNCGGILIGALHVTTEEQAQIKITWQHYLWSAIAVQLCTVPLFRLPSAYHCLPLVRILPGHGNIEHLSRCSVYSSKSSAARIHAYYWQVGNGCEDVCLNCGLTAQLLWYFLVIAGNRYTSVGISIEDCQDAWFALHLDSPEFDSLMFYGIAVS